MDGAGARTEGGLAVSGDDERHLWVFEAIVYEIVRVLFNRDCSVSGFAKLAQSRKSRHAVVKCNVVSHWWGSSDCSKDNVLGGYRVLDLIQYQTRLLKQRRDLRRNWSPL